MSLLKLQRGLIVSCQARADNPLHGPIYMGAMALAAAHGGATGIRVNGPDDVKAAKLAGLPVIGINKIFNDNYPVYITPNFEAAEQLAIAGADVIAIDCTPRARDGQDIATLVKRIKNELGVPVFADISTYEEGFAAADMGADYISTTLSGYTEYTLPKPSEPNLALVAQLSQKLSQPIVAEGRFNTPALAKSALEAGAFAVVVGTIITNPREITKAFVAEVNRA